MQAVAASADGRSIIFEGALGTPLAPGGFAVVATEPPRLAQVTETRIAVRTVDGRRANVLEGSATSSATTPSAHAEPTAPWPKSDVTPPTISAAPPPAPTLGRPGSAHDPKATALTRGDFATFHELETARALQKRRGASA